MTVKPSKKDEDNVAIQEVKIPAYSDEDNARIARVVERAQRLPLHYEYDGDKFNVTFDDEDKILNVVKMYEHFGTVSEELQHRLLNQAAASFRGFDERTIEEVENAFNVTAVFLNGVQPQDEIEGLMAVQMFAVHNVAMDALQIGRAHV